MVVNFPTLTHHTSHTPHLTLTPPLPQTPDTPTPLTTHPHTITTSHPTPSHSTPSHSTPSHPHTPHTPTTSHLHTLTLSHSHPSHIPHPHIPHTPTPSHTPHTHTLSPHQCSTLLSRSSRRRGWGRGRGLPPWPSVPTWSLSLRPCLPTPSQPGPPGSMTSSGNMR